MRDKSDDSPTNTCVSARSPRWIQPSVTCVDGPAEGAPLLHTRLLSSCHSCPPECRAKQIVRCPWIRICGTEGKGKPKEKYQRGRNTRKKIIKKHRGAGNQSGRNTRNKPKGAGRPEGNSTALGLRPPIGTFLDSPGFFHAAVQHRPQQVRGRATIDRQASAISSDQWGANGD